MFKNILIAALSATLLSVGGVAAADEVDLSPQLPGATATKRPAPVTPWFAKRPCKVEDGRNCAWNANEVGSMNGYSFITRTVVGPKGVGRLTCIFFEKRSDAKYDQCWRAKGGQPRDDHFRR